MKKKNVLTWFTMLALSATLSVTNIQAQPFGNFVSFDGVDDDIAIETSQLIEGNLDFTIEFWYKSCNTTVDNQQIILAKSDNLQLSSYPVSDIVIYSLCSNNTANTWVCSQSHQYTPDLKWHHIAITYNRALRDFEYFFDGVGASAGTSYNFNFSSLGTLYFGKSDYNTYTDQMKGYIDEIRISNVNRYTTNFTPPSTEFTSDANTRGLWHCNETNPMTSLLDVSGNNYSFIPTGNPVMINKGIQISQPNNVLSLNQIFDAYRWIDCSRDSVPFNAKLSQPITPYIDGMYAAEITDRTCYLLSDSYTITGVGLDEISQDLEITISPNPTTGIITIASKGTEITSYEIYSLQAGIILSNKLNKQETIIDLSILPSGTYFLKVTQNNKQVIKQIIKK